MQEQFENPKELPQGPLKPLNPRLMLYVCAGVALFLVLPAILLVMQAFCPGTSQTIRLLHLLAAAVLLALPGRLVWIMARRKRKTGQFSPTDEERLALRAKSAAQRASPRWRMGFTAIYVLLAILWAFLPLFALKIHPHPRPVSSWIFFSLMSLLGVYFSANRIRSLYRKPKHASSLPD